MALQLQNAATVGGQLCTVSVGGGLAQTPWLCKRFATRLLLLSPHCAMEALCACLLHGLARCSHGCLWWVAVKSEGSEKDTGRGLPVGLGCGATDDDAAWCKPCQYTSQLVQWCLFFTAVDMTLSLKGWRGFC